MKKITTLLFCAWLLPAMAFSQEKILRTSPTYDNVHKEQGFMNGISPSAKFALVNNDKPQTISNYPNFAVNRLSLNKPATFPPPKQINFEKDLFKINRGPLALPQ